MSETDPVPDDRSGEDVLGGVADQAGGDNRQTGGDGEDPSGEELSPLELMLATLTAERDEYLALAQAKQAEFENYRKQMAKRQIEMVEQAAAGLAEKMLPVLDALDAALAHGDDSLEAVRVQLLDILGKEGLVRIVPTGEPFDPATHEAVMHEEGEGGDPVVSETLRPGYGWRGRLVRAAMVQVRG
ncbi:MAG: nucleotide exchange factor GrpE [Actinobacteria bacterium]|nr:nucleotide exchange factor GrpE [Actinomycetota bacterium]